MNGLWMLLVFWAGAMTGFGVFAMMQVSRDSDERSKRTSLDARWHRLGPDSYAK